MLFGSISDKYCSEFLEVIDVTLANDLASDLRSQDVLAYEGDGPPRSVALRVM